MAKYCKITNFNAVAFVARENDVIKVLYVEKFFSKYFWTHDIVFLQVYTGFNSN